MKSSYGLSKILLSTVLIIFSGVAMADGERWVEGKAPSGETVKVVISSMSKLQYPRRAVRYGIEGHVEVAFDINEDGEVVDLRVVEAKPQLVFDKAAPQYIKKIKFLPPRLDGNGVYVSDLTMRMPFRLQ